MPSAADETKSWLDDTSISPRVVVAPPGPRSRALHARLARTESPAFEARREARHDESGEDHAPIFYARANGSNVTCADENVYVDLVAGFGACIFGHAPSFVAEAVERAQRDVWLALGDVYSSEAKVIACEKIAALFPARNARVMLGLSGADAVTCALKTAVLATGKAGIVAFEGAYHGLSYAPLAACGLAPGFRAPFAAQLGAHVAFAPYPDASRADASAELDRALTTTERLVRDRNAGAVIVEPILGRGGCVVPPPGFLAALRDICTRAGALLIADEIWTGMGRSGAILASLAETTPDLVCIGKGLGAGLPISACVGKEEIMRAWASHGGSAIHTATHFGAPSACAAASVAIDVLCKEGVAEHAREKGAHFARMVAAAVTGGVAVQGGAGAGGGAGVGVGVGGEGGVEIVGRGLMIGIRLGSKARALSVSRRLLGLGYITLTGGANGDVLTLTPALNVPERLLAGAAAAIAEALGDLPKQA